MNAGELLNFFRSHSIELELVDDKIKLKAPRGFMTDELLDSLKKNKDEIIALLKKNDHGQLIPPRPQDASIPLSFAQQRLWFLDQFEPGSIHYNIPGAVRMIGELDVTALQKTVNEIVRRHEALRTSFAALDGTPVQVIARQLDVPMYVVDLTSLPPTERESEALQLAQEEAQTPFDLSTGPLIRINLLRLAEADQILLFTLHHIVADGWSMGVLVSEVAALYPAFIKGKPSPLPELPIQYADFAHWQRQWLSGDILQEQLDYWTRQLEGCPTLLTLPTDHPRPRVMRHHGALLYFEVSPQTTAGLYSLSQENQATLFMSLVAAFNILLSRYSGQNDLCIGSPIANRNRTEIEGLIGFFVNTLVLRTRIDSSASFLSLLQQVRTTTLDAYAHQDVPFEQLVEVLNVERHTDHSPLFQVTLSLQNTPTGNLELPGLTLQPIAAGSAVAKFDLTLDVSEAEGRLLACLVYNSDLFEPATIQRMAGHFTHLLEAIVANPHARIQDLLMLSAEEQQQILVAWNDTQADYPQDKCIHELFEEQVERTPEAAAVVFEDRQLTYLELNTRANQLAHYLRSRGVGPDVCVGICMERSLEMIVALLGILKAGGAYLPLDPTYPKERIAFMLEDAKPAILLTQAHLQQIFPINSFCLDSQWDLLDNYAPSDLKNITLPDNLAYIIYTSGSTGTPKGIGISHRSAINLMTALVERIYKRMGELPGKRIGLNASISFDSSVKQLLMLLHGVTLYIVPTRIRADVGLLTAAISDWELDVMDCTPSQLSLLLTTSGSMGLPRNCLIGGEAIDPQLWNTLQQQYPDLGFYNVYGPTEATVDTVICDIHASGNTPVIGRPIANAQVYLLDATLHPVPVGIPGELCIGGVGLARGYLNRPDLTAEKFLPNPFSREPGARMYRSGDLARWLPASRGNIEFLGRIDHQVKLRGFRIELGEIEAALTALPEVREAVVLAREDIPGDKRLVAYLVLQAGHDLPEISELQNKLTQSLPEYMIPAHFISLETFPLTPSGKIDYRALPAPDMSRSETGYVAPRTPTEEILAQIWAEVLHAERIGIHDNFFELGGHSLLATQVVSRIRQALEAEVSLRMLFQTPTVAELVEQIQMLQEIKVLPLRPVARTEPLLLSFAQQRLWFLDQFEPGNVYYNIPGAIRMIGKLDATALQKTVDEIVRRHEVLRTSFRMQAGSPVQVIATQIDVPLKIIDLTDLSIPEREAHAQGLAEEEAQTPFDLSTGPLIRGSLLRLDAQDHILLFTLHHIVSDGWSMSILANEVAALYSAFVKGQPSPLPELPIQYADFAHWQRQWLRGDVLQRQLDYWTERLQGSPALLTLPTDHPRPAVQSHHGATLSFEISEPITTGLYKLNNRTRATLFMTLLAAFDILLARYSGQSDICVGAPIANRNRAEIEGLIGFFVNTLVLRTRVDSTASFETLLDQVRSITLEAYAHQDVPFEQLVEALNVERHTSHAPLFQVVLVLQNTPMGDLELPGLTLQPVATESAVAKFDLTLALTEVDGKLRASFEYNTDLFEPVTIQRMAGHFTRLLEAIVANPQAHIQDLSILDAAERHQLLVEWNDTQADYPQDKCIHELFEEQVERTPEAVAVVFEDQQLTYRELNTRANQLAHYLRSQGIGPDVCVGICMERSLEMIVALLGILKAGGAYLPLDPAYPKERLAYMLEDASPAVVLTQTRLQPTFPGESFCLDSQWDTLAGYPTGNLDNTALPDNLAYVIYTSGSTGRPKGTMLKHKGLSNLVHAQVNAFLIRSTQRILQFASFNFDASTSEIFMALSCGATLCLASRDDLAPGEKLEKTLQQLAIHVVTLPPVALNLLSPTALPGLETIIVAGEACPAALVAQWSGRYNFFNAYGPTETTVCASIQHCPAGLVGTPPIGYPISNVQVYVLDAALQPVPAGVAGELYVAGDGVARGYLNRPDLTAEKFLPDPFSSEPGARMYRTGDLVRWLPTSRGNIEFLGRIDHQVKLRGFRIELGEIEAALAALPEVREAVVLAREDIPGDKRLVAYLVMQAGRDLPEIAELRRRLAQSLPEYMIPAHFVSLEGFPLTPNGKIDRKALPAPDRTTSEKSYVAPRTPTEEALAQIWAEVLQLDKVGIHDNFFELGGHSLLAVRLMTRIQQTFQHQVPLSSLFQSPTLEQLAVLITERATQQWSPIVPIRPHGSRTPLFCIHEVTGFASFYGDLAQHLDPDQPLYGLQARGLDKQQAPHTSIHEMATCYREAIQQVQARGPYLLAGHSMGGMIAYEISQQLRQQGEEIAFLGLLDSYLYIPSNTPEPTEAKLLIGYLRQANRSIEDLDPVISETDEDRISRAFAIAQQTALVPADLCLADFQRYFEVYKTNVHAASTYEPQPYAGTATLFACQESSVKAKQANIDRWRGLVHTLELYEVPGNHRSMVLPPHVDDLAAELSNCLRRAMPETGHKSSRKSIPAIYNKET